MSLWDKLLHFSICLFDPGFVLLLTVFQSFWRILQSKTCDDSSVSVRHSDSAEGYRLPSRGHEKKVPVEIAFLYYSLDCPKKISNCSHLVKNSDLVANFRQNFLFTSALSANLRQYAKRI